MGIDLGAVAGGINKGIDWAQRDQQIEDQRAIQQEQMNQWRQENEYRSGLRKRQQDEFSREDKYRTDMSAVPQVGADVQTMQEDAAGNMYGLSRKQTAVSQARQQAQIAQNAGKFEEARKLNAWADEAGMKAAADAFHSYNIGYKGSSPLEYAQGLSKVITDDQSPLLVDGVEDLGGGRVRATLRNRYNNTSISPEFGSIDEIRQAALRHYDPSTYQKQVDRALAKQDKIDEERAKLQKVGPGEELYGLNSSGAAIRIATNANEHPTVAAARIRKAEGGAGGSGAGTGGASTKGSGVFQILDKLVDPAVDGQFRTRAYANAEVISQLNPNIPDSVNAQASMEYAKNPQAAKVSFDPKTGRWAKAIDFDGRRVLVNDRVRQDEVAAVAPVEADSLYSTLKQQGSPLANPPTGESDTRLLEASKIEIAKIQAQLARASGRQPGDQEVVAKANAIFDQQARPVLEAQAALLKNSKAYAAAEQRARAEAAKAARQQTAPVTQQPARPAQPVARPQQAFGMWR